MQSGHVSLTGEREEAVAAPVFADVSIGADTAALGMSPATAPSWRIR